MIPAFSLLLLISAIVMTLTLPVFFSWPSILFFPPFLIHSLYSKTLTSSLWMAALAGLFIDLLSTQSRFGLHTVSYTIALYLTSKLKSQFFEDSLSTMPIMTFFFSLFLTPIYYLLLLLLDKPPQLTPLIFAADFFLMPLLDSAYSVIIYTLPLFMIRKPVRKGSDYFLRK